MIVVGNCEERQELGFDAFGVAGATHLVYYADALHMLGEYERELDAIADATQFAPGMLVFAEREARALAALGRVDDVRRAIDRSLTIGSTMGTAGEVMVHAARELRAHGHREASRQEVARAVEWYRARATWDDRFADRAALARALYLMERWQEAGEGFSALRSERPDDLEPAGAPRRHSGSSGRRVGGTTTVP